MSANDLARIVSVVASYSEPRRPNNVDYGCYARAQRVAITNAVFPALDGELVGEIKPFKNPLLLSTLTISKSSYAAAVKSKLNIYSTHSS